MKAQLMKISFFRKYIVILRILWSIFILSLKIICRRYSRAGLNYLAFTWGTHVFQIAKAHFKIIDPYHLVFQSDRNYIIMSNHLSLFDIPTIFRAFSDKINLRMMAKKELFNVPIWGLAMKKTDFISVDRGNHKEAIQSLNLAKSKMDGGVALWIAPEGTRSRTGELLPFKKGGFILAKQTDAIIIPVGIRGTNKIIPPDTLDFSFDQAVEVHIGWPIDTREYPLTERERLIHDVRESIKLSIQIQQ